MHSTFTRAGIRHCLLALLCLGLAPSPALAAQISGVTLPPALEVAGRQLQLAGCGTREEFFTDIYVIGLYVPDPPLDRSQVLGPDKAKAVRLEVVYDGTVPNEVPDEWHQRLQEMVRQELVRTVGGFYKDIQSGDQVTITYTPQGGTTIKINREPVVTKPGNELMNAMLRLWIGDQAISDNLRRLLLQGSCESEDEGLF